jgi:hypothetical protein
VSFARFAPPLLVLTLGATSTALAAPPVSLSYDAADGCPSRADFEAALAARGASLQAPSQPGGPRSLQVRIERQGDEFAGSLSVDSDASTSSRREVHAADCGEVVKGLAVVAAIALGASEGAAAQTETEKPASEGRLPASADAAVATPPPPLRGNSFQLERKIEVTSGTLRIDRAQNVTLAAGANFAFVPNLVLPRYELSLDVTHFVTPPGGKSRIVGPIIEVSWNFMGPGTRHTDGFATRVYGFGAGVRTCSAATYASDGFSLLFCAEFGVGWMELQTKEAGFGIAGLGFDAKYNLSRLFHVGLRASGQAQLSGASAERPDGSELFKIPLFGAYAVFGAGIHFQ